MPVSTQCMHCTSFYNGSLTLTLPNAENTRVNCEYTCLQYTFTAKPMNGGASVTTTATSSQAQRTPPTQSSPRECAALLRCGVCICVHVLLCGVGLVGWVGGVTCMCLSVSVRVCVAPACTYPPTRTLKLTLRAGSLPQGAEAQAGGAHAAPVG